MTDHQREQFLLASEAHRRAKNANIMAAAATKAVIKHLGGPAEGHAIDHEIRTAATAYATSKEAIRLTVERRVRVRPAGPPRAVQRGQRRPLGHDEHGRPQSQDRPPPRADEGVVREQVTKAD